MPIVNSAQQKNIPGILVMGGDTSYAFRSVEFWSEQGGCILSDYPRGLNQAPTTNFVSNRLVTCGLRTCDIYKEGSWEQLQSTTASLTRRIHHSSAKTADAVLLIGGSYSNTTEWIPMDGSAAHQGPFIVKHGESHCTVQISDDTIVVTGGFRTEDYVTQYQLTDGTETPLTSLGQPRRGHACGVYQDLSGQQVSKRLCSYYCCVTLNYSKQLQTINEWY